MGLVPPLFPEYNVEARIITSIITNISVYDMRISLLINLFFDIGFTLKRRCTIYDLIKNGAKDNVKAKLNSHGRTVHLHELFSSKKNKQQILNKVPPNRIIRVNYGLVSLIILFL